VRPLEPAVYAISEYKIASCDVRDCPTLLASGEQPKFLYENECKISTDARYSLKLHYNHINMS